MLAGYRHGMAQPGRHQRHTAGNHKRGGERSPGLKSGPTRLTAGRLSSHNDELQAAGVSVAPLHHPLSSDGEDDGYDAASTDVFAAVRQKFNSTQENDREACAVLAAIEETLRETAAGAQGGRPSPTSYWAALMSALDGTTQDDVAAVTSIMYLLGLVFPRVPISVCRQRFGDAAELLAGMLERYRDAGSQALLKWALGCVSHLLAAQEAATWELSVTEKLFQAVLAFALDPRPKVRKAAQHAVKTLAGRGPNEVSAVLAGQVCLRRIKRKHQQPDQGTFYALNVLGFVLPSLPVAMGRKACERILVLMAGCQAQVYEACMVVLRTMFETMDAPTPPALLTQLLEALYQYEPSVADQLARPSWNSTMAAGLANLGNKDLATCFAQLPRLCESLIDCFSSTKLTVAQSAATCLTAVITEVAARGGAIFALAATGGTDSGCIAVAELVKVFEGALHLRYRAWYPMVLKMFATLYQALGSMCHPLLDSITTALVDLRSTDSVGMAEHIEQVVGQAIKAIGLEVFLEAVPLGLGEVAVNHIYPRAWLLPVIKASIVNTKLEVFGKRFLPLAQQLLRTAAAQTEAGNSLIATTYNTLYIQIWELLPSFCNNPPDLAENFSRIARLLGTALTDNPTLRPVVCSSLATLIRTADDPAPVAAFAKNYLIILFNLYCEPGIPDKDRQRFLSTVESLARVADRQVLATFLQTVQTRLGDATVASRESGGSAAVAQNNLMDLGLALGSANFEVLYTIAVSLSTSDESSLQKKAFKALATISSDAPPGFVEARVAEIQMLLQSTVHTASQPSKHHRVQTVHHLIPYIPGPELIGFIPEIIAEVILCTKEVNERTRAAAFECLIAIGTRIIELNTARAGAVPELGEYFSMVVAGLAGQTSHMQSATILALSRLLYQFREHLSQDQLDQLVEAICLLLMSGAREVVKAALGFVKVAIAVLPLDDVLRHIERIVAALVEDVAPVFRLKTKVVLERLIRKCSYDRVFAVTPEGSQRLLLNIRKTKEREKRRLHAMRDGNDASKPGRDPAAVSGGGAVAPHRKPSYDELMYDTDDGDDADSEDGPDRGNDSSGRLGRGAARKRGRSAHGRDNGAFLADDQDGDAIDLLDPSAAQRLRTAAPRGKTKRSSGAEPFTRAEDGRWIIEDPDAAGPADVVPTEAGTHRDRERSGHEQSGHYADRKRSRRPFGQEEEDVESDEEPSQPTNSDAKRRKPLGSEYRAKNAGGDVKLAGKNLPYAYLPFDHKQLNHRKRTKAVGNFKNLVGGTRKGIAQAKKFRGARSRMSRK